MAIPGFSPYRTPEPLSPSSMVDLAKLSLHTAEQHDAMAEADERSGSQPSPSDRDRELRELLIGNIQASIAVAEALTLEEAQVTCTVVPADDSLARRDEFLDWLREHVPDHEVVKSITNVADRYMVVETFHVDNGGVKRYDHVRHEPIMEPPFAVAIHRPMPRGGGKASLV